tara:strand:+ start:540 stop:1697 length:1158 start_codon:yes stop_codon:yes gene_type:complete
MALNSTTFSGKEFKVYVSHDKIGDGSSSNGCGAFNSVQNEFKRLDVEGITLPTFNPNQEFEMRTGSGRVAEFGQIFSSSKRVITEFTLSGRLTTDDLPVFIENALSFPGVQASNITSVKIPTGFNTNTSNAALTLATDTTAGASTTETAVTDIAAGEFEKTLSVAFVSPTGGKGYKFAGCVITSLTLDADMDSAAGRFNYSATFQTAFQPTKANMTAPSSDVAGANKIFLSDLTTQNMNVKDFDGSDDQNSITPLYKTFSLSIDSPTQFLGMHGTDGNPQLVAKGIPELGITISGTIKYDAETDALIEAHRDSGGVSYLEFNLGDIAFTSNAFATGTASSSKFCVGVNKAKLISAEVTSDDVAMVNFEAKVLDDGTNSIIEVVTA